MNKSLPADETEHARAGRNSSKESTEAEGQENLRRFFQVALKIIEDSTDN
jgi:hypothetical protein